MLLVTDIGNTNITLGVFDKNNLLKTFRFHSDINLSAEDYQSLLYNNAGEFDITDCVIGSVVEGLDKKFKSCVDICFEINSVLISTDMDFGINIKASSPEKVGIDRLANIAEARKYGNPSIVVDIGTASTLDITDDAGNFSGGIIMPGINIQLKALNEYTSKLPLIEPRSIKNVIADNTEDCILSGVIKGHACAIDGLILECEKELGKKAILIGTGGLLELISNHMSLKFDYIKPNLTLEGLKELHNLLTKRQK